MFFSTPRLDITIAVSHELIEAATNPLPVTNPAFNLVDNAHFFFEFEVPTENGDLCALSLSVTPQIAVGETKDMTSFCSATRLSPRGASMLATPRYSSVLLPCWTLLSTRLTARTAIT